LTKRKSNEEFILEVSGLVGDEYTFLEVYVNTNTKIGVRHNTCGHVYSVTPAKFLIGRRCPACKGERVAEKQKKSHEEFLGDVFNLVGEEYSILSEYTRSRNKIEVQHNTCGHVYKVTPNNFLRGRKCPNCFRNFKMTTDEFKERVYQIVGEEYTLLGEYTGYSTHVTLRHNECGHEYGVSAGGFLQGRRCPNCNQDFLKTDEQFREEVKSLLGEEYSIMSKYHGNKVNVDIIHNTCLYEYKVAPNNLLYGGTRCPKCSRETKSRGEKLIAEILDAKGVKYTREHIFPDCRYVLLLRFDFAILNSDGSVNMLIEYDGIQHFKPTYGEVYLEEQKKKDKIKNNYCKERGIELLRIPYTEFLNLETILNAEVLSKEERY